MAGDSSLEAWIAILLDDRRRIDCKAEIEGYAELGKYSTPLPGSKRLPGKPPCRLSLVKGV